MSTIRNSTTPLYRVAFFTFLFMSIPLFIYAYPPESDYKSQRIILNITETPSESQSVTWRTTSLLKNPEAQIGIAQESVNVVKKTRSIKATVDTVILDDHSLVFYYSVSFQNLRQNTVYAYRVGNDDSWSEWNQFRTADSQIAPFSLVYFGDPQNDILSKCSRLFRTAYRQAPDANFWLFTGDIVNNGDNDNEWDEFYDALGWISRTTPLILLPGNHGYSKQNLIGNTGKQLNKFWRPQFTLPENGPEGLKETTYFVDYQCARIFILNTNEKVETQAQWLDSLLTRTTKPWTIVSMHVPIYSTGKKRDNQKLREILLPVFDKHHVDLVLQGHDHAYGRTYKCCNGKRINNEEKGTVYVVSVCGSKVYTINNKFQNLMGKKGNNRQLYQVIQISKNNLDYASYNALGELYDSFVLHK